MLNFSKKILEKVSFDRELFRKELKKSLRILDSAEAVILYSWCLLTFGDRYKDVIMQVFTEETRLV